MATRDDLPSYAELRQRTDSPAGSTWGLFGEAVANEAGAVNLLDTESVLAGVRCVRRGELFNLDYPLNYFDPPPALFRRPASHQIIAPREGSRDDILDDFFLQNSSHIDGLRHKQSSGHNFYADTAPERIVAGDPAIGVNRWAERGGLVGRAVLLDVARYCENQGRPLSHSDSQPITPSVLETVAAAQKVELREGDMLLIRTDWPRYYADVVVSDPPAGQRSAGLDQSYDMLEWLWDTRIPVVASDNIALEAIPERTDSPFGPRGDVSRPDGKMHPQLIGLLGMVIGELWKLDALASDCAADGVYDALLVAKPLNLVGGVASPANAVAIK